MTSEMLSPGARAAAEALEAVSAGQADASKHSKKSSEDNRTRYAPQRNWRERNPVAHWAHAATRSAIRRGLIQPQSCEVCGLEKAEAHHPDHRDPLRVEWLCRSHHKARHAEMRRAAK